MQYSLPFLGKIVTVKVDRPMSSKHPKWGFEYHVNYGFIEGAMAPDGEELDAYVLNVNEPKQEFVGVCVAIIHRTDDEDDKLVVVPEGVMVTDEEIREMTGFQEQFFKSEIIRTEK